MLKTLQQKSFFSEAVFYFFCKQIFHGSMRTAQFDCLLVCFCVFCVRGIKRSLLRALCSFLPKASEVNVSSSLLMFSRCHSNLPESVGCKSADLTVSECFQGELMDFCFSCFRIRKLHHQRTTPGQRHRKKKKLRHISGNNKTQLEAAGFYNYC